ncbi:MAG: type II toxin-antitoxin system RelE/ParE family toxin [Gammaproteobacteria bacterium]
MGESPTLDVVFFRAASGREPVRDWLKALSAEDRTIIGGDINTVQWMWPLGRPLVAYLRDGVWEVRSRLDNREARVLFGIVGKRMVLLHGFIKKTRATPAEELCLAEQRWRARQGQEQGEQDE